TEENATDLEGLKNYLKEKDHPVVKNWKEEVVEEEMPAMEVAEVQMSSSGVPMAVGGGITIIFKNAKIYAEKVIIKKEK
ncbi:MAG: acetyl-CoA decarbonylase/synthase complex subunit beta, partial [Candidatus Hydrothermarchaeaceae archaeon]